MVKGRIDLLDDTLDRLFEIGEERFRIDADPEGERYERQQNGVLAKVEVGKRLVHFVSDRTEHRALIEPEQIRRAEDNAKRGPGGPRFADREGALQDGEFSDEAIEQRHAERTERDDEIDRGKTGHGRGQAAEFGDEARVTAFIEHANKEEERTGGNAVVDLLEHTAGKAKRREREDAKRAEAQVADGGIGDEALHVFLHEANDGAINDADERQRDDNVDDLSAQVRISTSSRPRT